MAATRTIARTAAALSLVRFQESMRSIVARGNGLDFRDYEVATAARIDTELRPATLTLLSEARTLLGDVLDECEALADSDWDPRDEAEAVHASMLPFERALDATVASKLGSPRAVEEVAFMAQLELRQRTERLERVKPAQGTAALLGECDSSLRRIRKALTAVDAAIATAAGVPPLLDFTSELQTSLMVRSAYAKFRARLLADGQPSDHTLRARFRGAGTQIAILVGRDVYPEMRVRDRLLLRELQQRVLAWLRGEDGASNRSGLRLWQDLMACVQMFSLVNRRQELVDHDAALVAEAVKELTSQAEDGPVAADMWRRLSALDGLDPELDVLIGDAPPPARRLLPVLNRLASHLGRSGSGVSPAGDAPW